MTEEGPAPVDLEKELTCSICTDLLYQPLTLLDCLHTFCGACLKEWFAFQASTATSLHPYTCPSCRARVRSTQPNATVTTLLDMFIQANPERGKTEEDKKADRDKFKYGDNVLPKLRRRGGEEIDEEERRVLEDVQALSLREVGIETGSGGASNNLELPRERRRRERSGDRRSRSSDTRRSREEGRSRSRTSPPVSASRESVPPRVIEHQSSLRSLLSASEVDSQEMEEEIMRQIMEEGLLDGIDLDNIDVAQEDEISERIAQAYRQRQTQRQRERRERRELLAREGVINTGYSTPPEIRSPPMREDDQQRRRPHGRSESGTSTPRDRERDNRPPISRPGLLDVANQGTRHARSSSQGSSRSARGELRPAPLSISARQTPTPSHTDPTTRSASETTDRPGPARRRQSDNQQHSTLAERQQFRTGLQTSSNPGSPRRAGFGAATTESPMSTVAVVSSPLSSTPASSVQHPTGRRTTDPAGVRQLRRTNGTPPMTSTATFARSTTDPVALGAQARSTAASTIVPQPTLFPEPRISCQSCGKDHIEYELHYNCSRCDNGSFNLCQPCYRSGKGCKHWYGFGWAAWPAYQKKAPPGGYPSSHEFPHVLRGHRYRKPQGRLTENPSTSNTLSSEEDPNYRLEEGVFCDICSSWANACFWKCDYCNEGEWGYCNDCVNQGRHCTHALLPLTHVGKEQRTPPPTASESASASTSNPPSTPQRSTHLSPPNPDDSPPTTPPVTPKSASLTRGPGHMTLANSSYRPLTFTVLCNICTYPILPSHTRFHCSQCTDGDYDICSPCYKKLCLVGKISEANGINGWRRCLRGHRMIVVGFEDRDGGQRRVVVRDLVGGLSLREEEMSSPTEDPSRHNAASTSFASQRRFPPDGGVGLRVRARWSYFPAVDAKDELSFPRFAEITEAEDINGDWFWGVYAGSKGLFPGNYGTVIGGNAERQGLI